MGLNVLVHCTTGNGRSAALIVTYLITEYKLKWGEAMEIVKNKRGNLDITEYLLQQIEDDEEKLLNLKPK